jgi:D-tyrosyl-tRNA(Tyr) deacylase
MRTVIQRVTKASVSINKEEFTSINQGLVIFLGIEDSDASEDINWLAGKIARLRIFNDAQGVMNCSVKEVNGELLVISQFTLHSSTKKGNRPSYIRASKPEIAIPVYEKFIDVLSNECHIEVKSGVFGADMQIDLINDGPVTILIDTLRRKRLINGSNNMVYAISAN